MLWSNSQIKAQTDLPKTGQEMTMTIGDLMAQQVKMEIVKAVQQGLKKQGFYNGPIDGRERRSSFQKALNHFYEETGVRKDGGMASIMEKLDLPFPSMSTGFDEYGKCFISCMPPQEYKTITRQVLVQPDAQLYPNLQPIYETQAMEVLFKEAYTEIIASPPVFETVQDTIVVQRAYAGNARFEPRTQRIEVSPETGQWVFKNPKNGQSSSGDQARKNPKNCKVVCWEKVPAQYETIAKQVSTVSFTSYDKNGKPYPKKKYPAKYKYIERKVLKEAASLKIINWSAEYKTEEQEVVVGYKSNGVLVPPTYTTIEEQVAVDGSGEENFLSPIWESFIW